MVFSFFKKTPEKMVARPAAVPRSTKNPDQLPRAGATGASAGAPAEARPSPEPAGEAQPSLDFADFVFSESSPDFQVESEMDPVDALAEEAAILFANGQDEAVRTVLENAVVLYCTGRGERLWQMLFDVYRLSGDQARFESLELEYARSFEKSPPGWRDPHRSRSKSVEQAPVVLPFRGNLRGDNEAAFDEIRLSLDKNPRLRVDLSKVADLDRLGCARLLAQLQQTGKARHELDLLGCDILASLLEERMVCGRAEDQECWLLFLELCQLQGKYDVFEEAAINYAVTFEVSPPSWEPRTVAPKSALVVKGEPGTDAGVYALRGDIKASRFADLQPHAEVHDPLLIDCALLTRIDFISAGALLNVLMTIRRSGKQIVFRHPHSLVAELFGVVGLKAVATIVAEKY